MSLINDVEEAAIRFKTNAIKINQLSTHRAYNEWIRLGIYFLQVPRIKISMGRFNWQEVGNLSVSFSFHCVFYVQKYYAN